MTTVTDAIFTNGSLKPVDALPLRESQRVRIIVQTLDAPAAIDRERALADLRAGIARMNFKSDGPYPTRDELHERR